MALTYDPLFTTTLTGNTDPLNITNIPQTHTDLIITMRARTANGGELIISAANASVPTMTGMKCAGTTTNGIRQDNVVLTLTSNSTADIPSAFYLEILDYRNTAASKSAMSMGGLCRSASANTAFNYSIGNLLNPSTAITSLTISGDMLRAGTTFTIWGVTRA